MIAPEVRVASGAFFSCCQNFAHALRLPIFVCIQILMHFLAAFILAMAAIVSGFQSRDGDGCLTYSRADGLASESVLDICEDENGVLWFATEAGLSRFDGHNFHTYLSGSSVTALCIDSCGNLWVGTDSGLSVMDRESGHFEEFVLRRGSARIRAVHAGRSGDIWVYTYDGVICKISGFSQAVEGGSVSADGQIHSIGFADFKGAYLEGDYRYCHIFENAEGDIWIGGRATSVAMVPNGDLSALRYPVRNPDIEHFEGSAFASDASGLTYASDDKGYFSVYDGDGDVFRTILKVPVAASCAVTDSTGRIWIGGRNGLIRLHAGNDNFDNLGLWNVLCLYADSFGNVWAGTDRGLLMFHKRGEALDSFSSADGLSSSSVTAVMQDSDGLLWIGTESDGVDTLNLFSGRAGNLRYTLLSGRLSGETAEREAGVLAQYSLHGLERDGGINENKVSALYQDSRGTVYIGLWSHVGFNTYDKVSGTFKRHCIWSGPAGYIFPLLFEGNPFGSNWYTGFLEDSRGNLWCTTWEGLGLNLFERSTGEFSGRHFIPGDVPRMPRGTICSHVDDPEEGRIYMAGGKWYGYFDLGRRTFHRFVEAFPENYPNADIIEGYYAYSPAEQIPMPVGAIDLRVLDKNGDFVAVASANALFCHNVLTSDVEVLFRPGNYYIEYTTVGTPEGIFVKWGDDAVLLRRRDGGGFGIVRVLPEDVPEGCGWPQPVLAAADGASVYDMHDDGRRLFAATSDGLFEICKSSGRVLEHFRHNPAVGGSLPDNTVTDVFGIGGDSLFVYTGVGAAVLLKDEGAFVNVSENAPRTLPSRLASCVAEDSDGLLWYGTTDSGLCSIDTENGEIRCFRSHPWETEGLPDNDVRDIFEASDGTLWVGTGCGVCRYDGGTFVRERVMDGISVRRILEDRSGRLWLSSDDGLYCLDRECGTVVSFSVDDGLSNDAWSGAAAALGDGRLVFGGLSGIDIIDPDSMLAFMEPEIVFSFLDIYGKILYHSVPEQVRLKYSENSFSVDFAIPGHNHSGRVSRYRLKGFDKGWNFVDGDGGKIKYTNLPSGKYVLEVETALGPENWAGSALNLEISRSPWRSWWFMSLVVLLSGCAVLLIIRLRETLLRQENAKLSELVGRRTEELRLQVDSKNKFFSIVSHDLKNPLGSLSVLSEELCENYCNMSEQERLRAVELIRDSSKGASKLLDEILLWALTHSGVMVPRYRELVLRDAVDAVIFLHEAYSVKREISLANEVDLSVKVFTDADMLSVILRNLVGNALKYSHPGGRVTISAVQRGYKVEVSVKDEGTGMTDEQLGKLFRLDAKLCTPGTDGKKGNGFGLICVHEFLEKLGEEIRVTSSPAAGSCFRFTVSSAQDADRL